MFAIRDLKNKPRDYWYRAGIIALLCAFAALRLFRLGYHDFWYDESFTASFAQYPLHHWNAPLYWIVLHVWIRIAGISEFSMRFPSAVFSLLSVILVYLLGKDLFNKKTGIVAGVLMGVSSLHLWYAQEARDYAMVLFLGTLSSYILLKAIRLSRPAWWLSYTLIAVAGMYTDYFFIILFITQMLTVFFLRIVTPARKMELVSFAVIILAFSVYLPRFLSKLFYVRGGFWIPPPDLGSLAITFENFMIGYNGTDLLYRLCDMLMIVCAVCALYAIRKDRTVRVPALFCACLVFIPVIAVFVFSRVFFSIYLDRGLMLFSPYFYLIVALGILYPPAWLRRGLFVSLIAVAFISAVRYYNDDLYGPPKHHLGTPLKKPMQPIAEFLDNQVSPADVIGCTSGAVIYPLSCYRSSHIPLYQIFDPALPDSNWNRPFAESMYCIPFFKVGNLKFKKIWLIAADWLRSGALDGHGRSAKQWLDDHYTLVSAKEIDGLYIYCYE